MNNDDVRTFSMSCYANAEDLYHAKAEYFEGLYAELVRESEWISIEDSLPEHQTEVIVSRGKAGFWWGCWQKGDPNVFFIRFGDSFRDVSDVTHWKPLPSPPK